MNGNRIILDAASKASRVSKWAIGYSVDGDLRFISHHDTLRLFRRAFARAELPVRYSEGFNPHPRMTIPLPRPLGIASDDEALVVEMLGETSSVELLEALGKQMPGGISLRTARRLEEGEQLRPGSVLYRLEVGADLPSDLEQRIKAALRAEKLIVKRAKPPGSQETTVDIRPYVMELRAEKTAVYFRLKVTGSGTARPAEIAELLGFPAETINHRIRRLEVQWQ